MAIPLDGIFRRLGLEPRRVGRFGLVGASGFFVNTALLWALTTAVHLFYLVASVVAIETAILTNFLLNYRWTWWDREATVGGALARFQTVSVAGLVLNLGVLALFTSGLHVYFLLSNVLGIALATLWNFYANDRWTFAPTAAPGDPAKSPGGTGPRARGGPPRPPRDLGTGRGR